MRVAFYAPLKSPDHPVPSGDRRMARGFVDLLRRMGHEVEVVSAFRSYDRHGDPARQERLARLGARLAARLLRRLRRNPPDLWFTYHVYHKAPDHLGPTIARALDIPYVIAEPSIARRRADGPWALGWQAALTAMERADLLLAMTRRDRVGLAPLARRGAVIRMFPPFLDEGPLLESACHGQRMRAQIAERAGFDPAAPVLLAVAMMRPDAKLRSYQMLAETLRHLVAWRWNLLIVGDGPAREAVERAFSPFGRRVLFLGALGEQEVGAVYGLGDILVWPAIDEAYGMALLEAQATGVPVVACDEGGVREIVAPERSGLLAKPRDPLALAGALMRLLDDPALRHRLAEGAVRHVARRHGVGSAARRLKRLLDDVAVARAWREDTAG